MHLKTELRNNCKALLAGLSSKERNDLGRSLSANLMNLLRELDFSGNLGGFAPLSDEINWMLSLDGEVKSNLSFPSIDSEGEMIFKESLFKDLEIKKNFGVSILEPQSEKEVVTPDLLVIPGLAFGVSGERLGRGKGYYDKFLTTYNGIKIGICLEKLLMDGIPMEPHDVSVNYIVTEKRFFKVTK